MNKSTGKNITNIDLGRVRHVNKGIHDIKSTYEQMDMVYSKTLNATYEALKNVPSGISIDNTAYWFKLITYDAALSNVQDRVETIEETIPNKKTDLWANCYSDTTVEERWFKLIENVTITPGQDIHLTFAITRNRTSTAFTGMYKAIGVVGFRYTGEGVYNPSESSFYIIASTDDTVDLSSRVFIVVESNKMCLYAKSETSYDGWRIDFLKNPTNRTGADITNYFTFYDYPNAGAALTAEPSGTKLLPVISNIPVCADKTIEIKRSGCNWDFSLPGKRAYAYNSSAETRYYKLAELEWSGDSQSRHFSFEIIKLASNPNGAVPNNYKANCIIGIRYNSATSTSVNFKAIPTSYDYDLSAKVFGLMTTTASPNVLQLWVELDVQYTGWLLHVFDSSFLSGGSADSSITLYPNQTTYQTTLPTSNIRINPSLANNIISSDGSANITRGQYFDISIPNSHTHSNKTVLDDITSTKVTNWDAASADSGWRSDFTFESNFEPYSTSGGNKPEFRKKGGVVYLSGAFTNKVAATSGFEPMLMATLPAGYRPSREITLLQQGSDLNTATIIIKTNGGIHISRYGTTSFTELRINTWINISCSFLVD